MTLPVPEFNMLNVCASIAYDGSRFRGFAPQPHQETVVDQLTLWCRKQLHDPNLKIRFASRTDAGVHALDHKIQLISESRIPLEKWKKVLNHREKPFQINSLVQMGGSWSLTEVQWMKSYGYLIRNAPCYPFQFPYSYCLNESSSPVNPEELLKKMEVFLGEHDFFHFCKLDKSRENLSTTRELKGLGLKEADEGGFFLILEGEGFLWQMVRYLVRYGLELYFGRVDVKEVEGKLRMGVKSPKGALSPAPPQGLYLLKSVNLLES